MVLEDRAWAVGLRGHAGMRTFASFAMRHCRWRREHHWRVLDTCCAPRAERLRTGSECDLKPLPSTTSRLHCYRLACLNDDLTAWRRVQRVRGTADQARRGKAVRGHSGVAPAGIVRLPLSLPQFRLPWGGVAICVTTTTTTTAASPADQTLLALLLSLDLAHHPCSTRLVSMSVRHSQPKQQPDSCWRSGT